jgi:hypothetical protein
MYSTQEERKKPNYNAGSARGMGVVCAVPESEPLPNVRQGTRQDSLYLIFLSAKTMNELSSVDKRWGVEEQNMRFDDSSVNEQRTWRRPSTMIRITR